MYVCMSCSQTTRHLAEFHMIEPEMAFADLWVRECYMQHYVPVLLHHINITVAADVVLGCYVEC